MSELRECPFCGCGEGNLYIVTIEQHGFETLGIFCNGCKQTVILESNEWEGDNEQSRKSAIEAWNRRKSDSTSDEIIYPKRWIDVYHYGFGYTKCPYSGDETGWYNPMSNKFQSDLKNNQRERCPKCGKRVYAREGWLANQPPIEEGEG